MGDFDQILACVGKYIDLTEDEKKVFLSKLRVRKIKKKQFIVQPDFICKYRSYVVNGALRSYIMCNDGQEHTIALAIDDWWISDFNSFIYQRPATLFVEALSNSTIFQIAYDDEQKLLEEVPKFERFFRILTQRGFAYLQRRILSNLSKTAEERYIEFSKQYPEFMQKVPQYAIASFLGITPVYLSQLRNHKAGKS
ncbi:Crp/Fnr family transcriptional regulator [Mucilaginibacter pedocola]|uniref:Crp/Fnr family transcriptional regulator n=1 Tax=Mucilaginibacter pedocola TaxID=1792845 RepID=A0A1S9PHI4_9SPHI|nr:Crp/Fnr family transcriptional regulator [Mucilaginibacter pedocola]OOQ60411.1 Crp/Fnr family transcriptional regulator [Mucilaginibacter pedocola]